MLIKSAVTIQLRSEKITKNSLVGKVTSIAKPLKVVFCVEFV